MVTLSGNKDGGASYYKRMFWSLEECYEYSLILIIQGYEGNVKWGGNQGQRKEHEQYLLTDLS